MTKRALITGVTGQDGSYPAELPLGKGYEMHGRVRCADSFNTQRVDHLHPAPLEAASRFTLRYADHQLARQERLLIEAGPGEACRGALGA